MHMLPVFDTLFPGAATKLKLYLDVSDGECPSEVYVQVRIFSTSGLRDFPLGIRRTAA